MKTHSETAAAWVHGLCKVFVLCPVLCLFTLAPAGHASGDDPPIWAFDFRDTFYDIAFHNQQEAVIVGARGRVLVTHKRHKSLWSVRDSGTKELLTCLSFADDKHGWAAGHGGIILYTADGGQTWEVQRESLPENQPLFDIQCLSPKVAYACGAFDTFLKTTDGGNTWTSISTAVDNIYNGLAFLDEDNGFLAGEFGTVLRTTDGGRSWRQLDLGGYEGSLFGITLLSEREILAYGIAGKIMRSEDGGHTWEDVSPGIRQSLFRAAVNRDEVLIVGAAGTILYSSDGGKRFEERNDKDLTTFAGVSTHPEGGFLCVGERGKIFEFDISGQNEQEDAP